MPQNSSSNKFLNRLKILFFLFLVASLFYGVFYSLDSLFSIKKVEVVSDKKDFIGISELKKNNLIFLSEEKIIEKIIENNPSIQKVEVEKKYPSTLVLKLTVEKPIANLLVNNGYFYLSQSGKILSKARAANMLLPVINYYQRLNFQSYSAGDFLDFKDIKSALYLTTAVSDLNFKIDNLDIGGVNMIVCNVGDKKIVFSSEKDNELQVYQLAQIVKQFKVEGKQFREVDLRFDKPVVRF